MANPQAEAAVKALSAEEPNTGGENDSMLMAQQDPGIDGSANPASAPTARCEEAGTSAVSVGVPDVTHDDRRPIDVVGPNLTPAELDSYFELTVKIVSQHNHSMQQIVDMLWYTPEIRDHVVGVAPTAEGRFINVKLNDTATYAGMIFEGIECPHHNCVHHVHPAYKDNKTIITFFNTVLKDDEPALLDFVEANKYKIIHSAPLRVAKTWRVGIRKFLVYKDEESIVLPEVITRFGQKVGVRHKEQDEVIDFQPAPRRNRRRRRKKKDIPPQDENQKEVTGDPTNDGDKMDVQDETLKVDDQPDDPVNGIINMDIEEEPPPAEEHSDNTANGDDNTTVRDALTPPDEQTTGGQDDLNNQDEGQHMEIQEQQFPLSTETITDGNDDVTPSTWGESDGAETVTSIPPNWGMIPPVQNRPMSPERLQLLVQKAKEMKEKREAAERERQTRDDHSKTDNTKDRSPVREPREPKGPRTEPVTKDMVGDSSLADILNNTTSGDLGNPTSQGVLLQDANSDASLPSDSDSVDSLETNINKSKAIDRRVKVHVGFYTRDYSYQLLTTEITNLRSKPMAYMDLPWWFTCTILKGPDYYIPASWDQPIISGGTWRTVWLGALFAHFAGPPTAQTITQVPTHIKDLYYYQDIENQWKGWILAEGDTPKTIEEYIKEQIIVYNNELAQKSL